MTADLRAMAEQEAALFCDGPWPALAETIVRIAEKWAEQEVTGARREIDRLRIKNNVTRAARDAVQEALKQTDAKLFEVRRIAVQTTVERDDLRRQLADKDRTLEREAKGWSEQVTALRQQLAEAQREIERWRENGKGRGAINDHVRAECREVAELLNLHEAYRCSEVGREEIRVVQKRLEDAAGGKTEPEPEPKCAICGTPPTCIGEYETDTGIETYGCDDCCGHCNEDGHCTPVAAPSPAPSEPEQCNATWNGERCELTPGHTKAHNSRRNGVWQDFSSGANPHVQAAKEPETQCVCVDCRNGHQEYHAKPEPAPPEYTEKLRLQIDLAEARKERDEAQEQANTWQMNSEELSELLHLARAEAEKLRDEIREATGMCGDREIDPSGTVVEVMARVLGVLWNVTESMFSERDRAEKLRETIVELERIRRRTGQLLGTIEHTHRADQIEVYQREHSDLCRKRAVLLEATEAGK